MPLEFDICYRALAARDARFDGAFFVGVRTTGIYCRSICSARTPLASSCQFYSLAAAAEAAGFRPCLRCRPEIAPGVNQVSFPDALLNHLRKSASKSIDHPAENSGVSARQMRRIMVQTFGVTPVQIRQTERLLLAKRLLQETCLPVTEIGDAAGFQSLRRFNALFKKRYQLSPSRFRTQSDPAKLGEELLTLRLEFRPPYAWKEMLAFLGKRAIPTVEFVDEVSYSRVVAFGATTGLIRITHARDDSFLTLSLPSSFVSHISEIIHRLRGLFDLDANPQIIANHLQADPFLEKQVGKARGLRVPGAWSPFELAVRAILGQQVSVAGATTLAGRLVQRFGTPLPGKINVFFEAHTLGEASLIDIQSIGLPRARAAALQSMAQAFANGKLDFKAGTAHSLIRKQLLTLPGIGPWTADYLLLRVWRDPDAFPAGDLALRKAAGNISEKQLIALSQPWRPWRAYATMHLWQSLAL